ncbi:DUF3575 domain-containing protein [Hymenobacter yonginensis]|uniref:DUF3575 domain-containing protein n=1 Tax=Hymenobacter yonginensis TaxID=748197 RepID=A0ABY7PMB3_9BACT|nr:DUF3575 domain-containing protein [Hymenobacter yonginensis]WBO83438.1 DUF3575 domain-containing protein [Hymenobacter yonginensis]
MKKLVLSFVLLGGLTTARAQQQPSLQQTPTAPATTSAAAATTAAPMGAVPTAPERAHVLKTNILSPLLGSGTLFYEQAINSRASVQLGVFGSFLHAAGTEYDGFGLTPEYRRYLTGEVLNGLYVGSYLRVQRFRLAVDVPDNSGQTTKVTGKMTTLGGGLLVGRQWIFGQRFVVDPYLGVGYDAGQLQVSTQGYSQNVFGTAPVRGLSLRPGISLGFAF